MSEPVRYFRPRNWEKFQGYRKRGPTWIKLHTELLHNHEYASLTLTQRAILVGIWMLYARTGKPLPYDTRWTGAQLAADSRATGVALKALLSNNFIELCAESVAPHARATETETETEIESDKSDSSETAIPDVGQYAFNGAVIRITDRDLRQWVTSFPHVDVRAELTRLDAYYAETGDRHQWFMRCASVLAKRNAEAGNGVAKPKSVSEEFV